MNYKKVIMSAERSNLDEHENDNRTRFLLGWLHCKGYSFKKVVGSYEGSQEISFLIDVDANTNDVGLLINMGERLEQDSVLLIDDQNQATLVFCKDKSELNLGTMIEVSEQVAKNQSNFTWDKELNKYYVTRTELPSV